MFEHLDIYDNEWYYYYTKAEEEKEDFQFDFSFYLFDTGIAIPDYHYDTLLNNPDDFLKQMQFAIDRQKKIFSEPQRVTQDRRYYPFKFYFKRDPISSGISDIYMVDWWGKKEGSEDSEIDKLYEQWVVDKLVDEAIEKGKSKATAIYEETIRHLKDQNEILERSLKASERGKTAERKTIELEKRELESLREQIKAERAAIEKAKSQSNYGFVYLIHDKTENVYKIGLSKNPKNRLAQLRTSSTHELEIHWTIETIDMVQLEYDLHQHFASKRLQGEWFALSPEDIMYIKELP